MLGRGKFAGAHVLRVGEGGALGVGPDRGILELALYLLEPLALDVEVKDTP